MESEQHSIDRKRAPQQWKSCKLIIDPLLTNGLYKVYRYDGHSFNIPVDDLGVFPVETVRDPRICRLWSKCTSAELAIPKYKIDEYYVGPVPPKEVTFARLNDNVKEAFLTEMCKKYGEVDEVEIFYNPKTIKHLGIGKVIFDTVKAARDTVRHLHDTSVMGNIIHVEVDPKGENRKRYFKLLVDGIYTPWTLPVGSNEQSLQSLIDTLPGCKPPGRESFICSPTSISTPLSLDTAYSSICQDTPQSFGLTPRSQGTPCTPYLSGTPLSQDSCYSSLQATPVQQGDPPAHTIHTVSRRDVYRKPGRHNGRHRKASYLSCLFKHFRPQPPLPLFSQTLGADSGSQAASCVENSPPSGGGPTDPSSSFFPSRSQGVVTTALSLGHGSPSQLLGTNGFSDRDDGALSPPAFRPCVTELPPSPVAASPGGLRDESESLDSRIEMLLNKSRGADDASFPSSTLPAGDGTEGVEEPQTAFFAHRSSQYRPASDPVSVDSAWTGTGSLTPSRRSGAVSPSPVPEDEEEDETVQAVASLLRVTPSPLLSPLRNTGRRVNPQHSKRLRSEDRYIKQDKRSPASRRSAVFTSKGTFQSPPPSFPGPARIPTPHFRFPLPSIPPSVPLFRLRLPNGTIPFPPPCWPPPPSLGPGCGIARPPPSIPPPPPPTLLGPRPTLMAPPAAAVHPGHSYPLHVQPPQHLGMPSLPGQASAPWGGLPLPRFNPFMPPPGYEPRREDPNRVTVEKVIQVFMEELSSIIKKDITRRMVEVVAFKAFDKWWDDQEQKSKMFEVPLQTGSGRPEQRAKPKKPLCPIIGQHKPVQLPSFKVKRKESLDPGTSEASQNTRHTSPPHQHNVPPENTEPEKVRDGDELGSETADAWSGGGAALRRRHARPLLLDDSDDEAEEGGAAKTKENEIHHQEEEERSGAVRAAPLTQCNTEDHDEMENQDVQRQTEHEEVIISNAECFSDSESLSEMCSSFWEDSDGSSVSGSSISGTESNKAPSVSGSESMGGSSVSSASVSGSESIEASSDCDLSSEEEDYSRKEPDSDEGYIVISSDEERIDLESPASPRAPQTPQTPQTPLTPGARLELTGLQDWYDGLEGESPGKDQYTDLLDPLLENYPAGLHPGPLQSPFMQGMEATFDLPMDSPEWRPDSPATLGTLRPPTPTGSLGYGDPDLLVGGKPTPPAERPRTPGRGVAGEDSADEFLSLPLTGRLMANPLLSPSPELHASYPADQDRPKTPGREEGRGWGLPHASARVPATPGGAASPSKEAPAAMFTPPLSSCSHPYVRTPRTPGRDIVLRHGPPARRRRRRSGAMGGRGGPPSEGSPLPHRFLPDSSAEPQASKGPLVTLATTSRPLQGLENMPGLLHSDGQRAACRESGEQWRWQRERRVRRKRRRRWVRQRRRRRWSKSPPCRSPPWSRSQCEETEVLHDVWREGLDEEDARLLLLSHQRLLRRDNGLGWLSDTLTPGSDEDRDAEHGSGCARSEGFYTISRTEKLKNLNDARLAPEPPATSALGFSTSAHPQSSLRAGSDFRSEQRRLLSSFSCDSDLVKFNQLKFRKKRIRFARSHIHDWGLFALEPIAADELVIEYVGQTIRQVIADMREKQYEEQGIGSSYLFRVDQDTIIDATKCGNLARFINHSCNPNCYAKIITVESQKKIVIYSRQPIAVSEEITYDYKFPIEDEKIPCLCGADGCHGTLN
ncbi:unnamed protein product [Arctogadus glacialis]